MESPLTIEKVTEAVELLDLNYWVSGDSTSVLVPFGSAKDHGGFDIIIEVETSVLSTRIIPKDLEDLVAVDPVAPLAMCNVWNMSHRWPTAVFEPIPRPFVRGDVNQHFVFGPTLEQLAASIELPLAIGSTFVRFVSQFVCQGGLTLNEADVVALLDIDDVA